MAQTLNAPSSEVKPRPWTREEIYAAVRAGILEENPRTELIEGQVYVQPIGDRPHTFVSMALTNALQGSFGKEFFAMTKLPLPPDDHNELWPDVGVLPNEAFEMSVPDVERVKHTVLVVEIAGPSLNHDQTIKSSLYVKHGVPEYWIVNVLARTIEVRREPRSEGYAEIRVYAEDESIPVGTGVAVADVLPRA